MEPETTNEKEKFSFDFCPFQLDYIPNPVYNQIIRLISHEIIGTTPPSFSGGLKRPS